MKNCGKKLWKRYNSIITIKYFSKKVNYRRMINLFYLKKKKTYVIDITEVYLESRIFAK